MNIVFHTCIFGLFYVVIADAALRKGHLTVHAGADVLTHHGGDRRAHLNFVAQPEYCSDPHCEKCTQDDVHSEKTNCIECSAGFGLMYEAKECDAILNCQNTCVPCKVKGCAQCSTLASSCVECGNHMTLKEGKCTDAGWNWDWVPGVSSPPSKTAKRAGEETVKGGKKVYDSSPAMNNPLLPFQSIGVTSVVLAGVLYFVLVFAVAFCYMQFKGPRLTAASGYLPEDGFSDAICECGQSWTICLWACLCPCIRWSDTVSQMRYLSFYLAILIWCALMLCNSMLTGLGFLLVVFLGAWNRNKIRGSFGLPRTCRTGVQDIIAWMCCQPCAIAQEARHVERALGLRTSSQR